ncbi:HAD family hydrolase [Streptomyces sp. NPDC088910]|uniref:HAD family hydrolase n=1 Tax=Streptomyces sp. NPDC088910 TaxID=3365911 RepID=UPI0038137ED4
MAVKGVMFDFSGTLMRVEAAESWLRSALTAEGVTATDDEVAAYAGTLERAGALPGGGPPERIPPRLAAVWARRDTSAAEHRAAYGGLSRTVALPWDVHDALYDRHMAPAAWNPYPDTERVLRALRDRGVPVAVVSNIGWDLRPVFGEHGLDELVDVFALSFEHGVQKPDERLFRIACDGLGLEPADVAMVGDSRAADGGAAALGCPVFLVDHLPVTARPDALLGVLDRLGYRLG